MRNMITLIVLGCLCFMGFVIYFFFKALGFVVNATRLYRGMIARQDAAIKLLVDIRDSTKNVGEKELNFIRETAESNVLQNALQSSTETSEDQKKKSIYERYSEIVDEDQKKKFIYKYYRLIKEKRKDLSDFDIVLILEKEFNLQRSFVKRIIRELS